VEHDTSHKESRAEALRGVGYAAMAAVGWWVFIAYGPFWAMFWFIVPLALVCFLYVTAMLRLVELSILPKLLLTLAAPAPALIVRYLQLRADDTLGQAAIVLSAGFIALVAFVMSLPSLVALLKSANAFKWLRAKRARP
jgi:hypothetical protein